MPDKNYYDILGVSKTASQEEIKTAYHKKAMENHPDKHVNETPQERQKYTDLFREIKEAYDTLSNPLDRASYDEKIKQKENYSQTNYSSGSGFNSNYTNQQYNNYDNYDENDYSSESQDNDYEDEEYDDFNDYSNPDDDYYDEYGYENPYQYDNYDDDYYSPPPPPRYSNFKTQNKSNIKANNKEGCMGCLVPVIIIYLIICGIIAAQADINFFAVLFGLPILLGFLFIAAILEGGGNKR